MLGFTPMFKIVPEAVEGNCSISHFGVSKREADFSGLRAALTNGREEAVREGVYCRLTVHGTLMMTDTSMEQRSNYAVVHQARGHVLIAGLGIGMLLPPILSKPEVTSVTVIEKYPEVVKLVEPHVRKAAGRDGAKLSVIMADIFDWKPPKGSQWDVIYFDIWPDICTDNLVDMTKLHRKFARRKAPGGWMNSWMKASLERRKQQEKRAGW